jgi:hypothetical protein
VTEKDDYEPIKQSYEIRELRKENMRLKERLRARKQAGSSAEESDASSGDRKRPPKVPFKPSKLQQRRFRTGDPSESLYFGSPGLASVVADVCGVVLSLFLSTLQNFPFTFSPFGSVPAPMEHDSQAS